VNKYLHTVASVGFLFTLATCVNPLIRDSSVSEKDCAICSCSRMNNQESASFFGNYEVQQYQQLFSHILYPYEFGIRMTLYFQENNLELESYNFLTSQCYRSLPNFESHNVFTT